MKKRILALALAGTTAFSVFGSALSANAYGTGTTTDTNFDVDAYMSYSTVAGTINSTPSTSTPNKQGDYLTDKNTKTADTETDANKWTTVEYGTGKTYSSVKDYVYKTYPVTEEYDKQDTYTFTTTPAEDLARNTKYKEIDLVYVEGAGGPFIRAANDITWATGYTATPLDGTYYVSSKVYETISKDANGYLNNNAIYYAEANTGDLTKIAAAKTGTNEFSKAVQYKSTTDTNLVVTDGKVTTMPASVKEQTGGGYVYTTVAGTSTPCATVDALVTAMQSDYTTKYTKATEYTPDTVKGSDGVQGNETSNITEKEYAALKSWEDYDKNIEKFTTYNDPTVTGAGFQITDKSDPVNTWNWNDKDTIPSYKEWTFNSNMDGDITIEPYKIVTSFENGKLVSKKEPNLTIYAFDFFPANFPAASVSTVANAWNDGTVTDITAAIGDTGASGFVAEKNGGNPYMGIRYEVVTEWEEFLEELSLDNSWLGYYADFDEFCDNYEDMIYNDPQYDVDTGLFDHNNKVDLYNIKGLLRDIWELRTATPKGDSDGYYTANTSELLYLMQQYEKYVGNYFDKTEVATDEWGDLLLSVLDAATEEDFKDAKTYRQYQNKVEDLRDAYETATTLALIERAEKGMYELLTTTNSKYTASKTATVDKTALGDTMEGLYFNVKSAPTEYTVMPSTLSTNVDYSNYNYYVAALKVRDSWVGPWTDNMYFTSTLSRGYYSLYPMADYYEAGNSNEVYAGNAVNTKSGDNAYVTSKGVAANYYEDGSSTDEYQWFWNVYQLAVNMNADNNKQGSIDAINDALNDAVAELAVTTTPNSTEVGAVEDALEKYAGKIDTDYNEGYYAKYTQATDYAENVAEGKWQTRIAAMVAGVAGEALTYQGTQVTVTKNDMKTVETAIKNGETALEAIKADPDYNAAQVTALNKAINQAQYLVDLYEGTYSTKKDDQSVNKNYTKLVGDKDQMVKSDLTAAIEAIDAAINYSEIVMGWSKNDAGKWQYGTEEGYLNDGWHQVDGGKTWYYFTSDGTAMQSDWLKENGKWYWLNSNCGAAYGWAKVDGEWYYFNGDNSMRTGWVKVEGNWYYLASSGKMVTGWCEVDGKWYYFSKKENALGQMEYNTTIDGYKLGADGAWIK